MFPISKGLNLFYRARGARADELPHSYQVMLFWAGLRGAVGVALAAGMKGENAIALRTTVLVTVVLTVVVFGGSIGRIIEILGIRTGVEEEGESSEEETGYGVLEEEDGGRSRKSKRRSFGAKGLPTKFTDGDLPLSSIESSKRFRDDTFSSSNKINFSSDLSNSSESDEEVLPSIPLMKEESKTEGEGDLTRVWRDGQWFTVLDERYLLPVFSNATASRRQASRKALKVSSLFFARFWSSLLI